MKKPGTEIEVKTQPVKKVTSADKEITSNLKAKYDTNPNVFFVDSDTPVSEITEADLAGKKLIFDLTSFPKFPPSFLSKLSKPARQAYSQDARYSLAAEARIESGASAYSSVQEDLRMSDPLRAGHVKNKFNVDNKKKGYKYLFPLTTEVDGLLRAGYEVVKPGDGEIVSSGDELGDKVVIKNNKGIAEHTVVRVPQKDYDAHIAYYGNMSKNRLGTHSSETKEKLQRYAPRVKIYDESKIIK